jgi:hypothetical protein
MKNKLKHYKNQTNLEIMLGTETSPQHKNAKWTATTGGGGRW